MVGARRGVIKLLKERGQVEYGFAVWCFAHRLELAVKDAFKNTYMSTVVDTLTMIYYFYKGSGKRNKEIQDLSDIMDEHFLKPEKANGTRWVEHKLKAVVKMIRNWKLIIVHLMSYAEDNTNRAEDREKAKGIITKIRQYKFVYYCHFIADLLGEVTKISLLFQREKINVSSAVTKLEAAHLSLNAMLNNNGTYLDAFDNDVDDERFREHSLLNLVPRDTLERQKRSIVQDVLDCISGRFDDIYKDPVYVSCHVFDHKNWPDSNDAEGLYIKWILTMVNMTMGQNL